VAAADADRNSFLPPGGNVGDLHHIRARPGAACPTRTRCAMFPHIRIPIPDSNKENTMVLAEFSMSPFDKGDSLSQYVARSLDIIDKSGLPYQLTPMGTIVEGEWDEVMALITACYQRMNQDCNRISTSIKIDYRAGKSGRLKSKIQAIESKLGRTLSK
jgi:uncharacterized protein (TIGR00106 family)